MRTMIKVLVIGCALALAACEGAAGPAGDDGSMGLMGAQGAMGAPGKDGTAAAKGDKGDKGDPGAKGDTGATGPAGRNGADGKDGAPGVGQMGVMGNPGKDGKNGVDGAPGGSGPPGQKGADGTNGTNGKDAKVTGTLKCSIVIGGSTVTYDLVVWSNGSTFANASVADAATQASGAQFGTGSAAPTVSVVFDVQGTANGGTWDVSDKSVTYTDVDLPGPVVTPVPASNCVSKTF